MDMFPPLPEGRVKGQDPATLRTMTFWQGQSQLQAIWDETTGGTHAHPPPPFSPIPLTPRATPWRAAWLSRVQTPLGYLFVSVAWDRIHLKQTLSGRFWK